MKNFKQDILNLFGACEKYVQYPASESLGFYVYSLNAEMLEDFYQMIGTKKVYFNARMGIIQVSCYEVKFD